MRGFIRRVLDLSGFEVGQVFEAADGLDALAVLEEHTIDVILTDINMPRMDGEELMVHLREDDDLQDVPVLVLSADSSEARMSRMLAASGSTPLKALRTWVKAAYRFWRALSMSCSGQNISISLSSCTARPS